MHRQNVLAKVPHFFRDKSGREWCFGFLGICNEFGTIEGSLWIERAKEFARAMFEARTSCTADTEVTEKER